MRPLITVGTVTRFALANVSFGSLSNISGRSSTAKGTALESAPFWLTLTERMAVLSAPSARSKLLVGKLTPCNSIFAVEFRRPPSGKTCVM